MTYKFLYKLKVFQPDIALFDRNREISCNDIHFIAKNLDGFDINSLKAEWFGLYSDFIIEEKHNFSKLNFDEMWKKILKCHSNIIRYPNLTSLLNAVRALPHSNADLENVFSFIRFQNVIRFRRSLLTLHTYSNRR